jgi:DME family drug/metabolite transporter
MSVAAVVLLLGLTQTPVVLTGLPWLSLLYLALVPTVLSYVLYTRGLAVVGATTAASLTLLEPLVSTMLAVGVLGERMSALSWVGAVVLGMSLLLVARRA